MKTSSRSLDRRTFLTLSGLSAAALPLRAEVAEPRSAGPVAQTGNGEWTYRVVDGWGALPSGMTLGGTHGAIANDGAGRVYVSTQSTTGIVVYESDGRFVRTMAHEFPEVHSLVHATEGGIEYFYATVQHGTPTDNWLFVKMKTDGTVVLKITAPAEAGFKAPNEWRLTSAVPGPDGSIFIANGYGDSRIFRFDKAGTYKGSFSGKGTSDGQCNCSHGLAVDTRYNQPLLLVCDRENRRLSHYDFDGKFVSNVTQHLRRPCQVSFHGEHAVVSELEGRVTVLDKNNAPVAFLGDNPKREQWANYKLPPESVTPAIFSAAHGCHIDGDGNMYVSDWNQTGRITKLSKLA